MGLRERVFQTAGAVARHQAVARRVGAPLGLRLQRDAHPGKTVLGKQHRRAGLLAQRPRQRVVVGVEVRDDDLVQIRDRRPDLPKARLQRRDRCRVIPTGVDERQAVAVVDRVDVDRLEPVAGHRQRDAVDPLGDGERSGLGPLGTGCADRHASTI